MAQRLSSTRIVCLTGPESSGKTRLAGAISQRFAAPVVAEQARAWLAARGGRYDETSLALLANHQRRAEQHTQADNPESPCIVMDTDIQVIEVWWWRKYAPKIWQRRFSHQAPPIRLYPAWLQRSLADRTPRYYLLMQPDLPWQYDSLRESPGELKLLFDQYQRVLERDNLAYALVNGAGQRRIQSALRGLHKLNHPLF